MMWKRYQDYAQANPLSSWLIAGAVLLVLNLTFFWGVLGPGNSEHLLMPVILALSAPTGNLLARFSEEQRHERPVPLGQERGVGLLSLFASVCSLGAWGVLALHRHLGLSLLPGSDLWLLDLFSVSALLSLALGYAARRTKVGRWGLGLSSVWLLFFVGAAVVKLFLRG